MSWLNNFDLVKYCLFLTSLFPKGFTEHKHLLVAEKDKLHKNLCKISIHAPLKNITQYFEDIGSLVLRGAILLNSVSVQTSRRNPFSDPDI